MLRPIIRPVWSQRSPMQRRSQAFLQHVAGGSIGSILTFKPGMQGEHAGSCHLRCTYKQAPDKPSALTVVVCLGHDVLVYAHCWGRLSPVGTQRMPRRASSCCWRWRVASLCWMPAGGSTSASECGRAVAAVQYPDVFRSSPSSQVVLTHSAHLFSVQRNINTPIREARQRS